MQQSFEKPFFLQDQPKTMVDLFQQRAEKYANQVMYIYLMDGELEEVQITYSEMARRAQRIAAWLQERKLVGERALLLFPPGLDFIAAYFGCLYAGVVAVPSYPPRLNRPSPRIQRIVGDSQAMVVLTTQDIYSSMEQRFEHTPDLKELTWLDTASLPAGLEEHWRYPAIDSDSLAFLQYTSGSTSQPKGVMVTHANLLHNLNLIRTGFRLYEGFNGVIWLPNYHDMGLIGGILTPMYLAGQCVLMSPLYFLQRPLRWLQAISRYKGEASGGPNFAFDLCVEKTTPEQRQELDLSSWQVAFSGAEPVRAETIENFANAFAVSGFKRSAFYPCYGLAEATLFVSGGNGPAEPKTYWFSKEALGEGRVVPVQPDSPDAQPFISCGFSHLDEKIAIVDPEQMVRCPADTVGEIWVSGGSIARGYWRQPEETERVFNAHILDEKNKGLPGEGPYMRTGDLGFLYENQLFITGRKKDLIIIRGTNHYPQDIEATVEKCHPALELAGGAAFSIDLDGEEQLVVVHELKRTMRNADQNEIFLAIRRAISENHDLQLAGIQLLKPLSVPKTSSGKIQRHACKEGYLKGTLEVVGEWRKPALPGK
jgi:acyl-CoA synthetase (AMP-forming)/AMP-acid ligase II